MRFFLILLVSNKTGSAISISPLWTFHLYVATFQQHLHMAYIYISVDRVFQSLWFLWGFPWYMVADNREATEPRVPLGYVEVITSNVLQSPPWLGWPLWNVRVTNDHGYVTLVVNTSRSFPHSWLITGFITRLTPYGYH